MRKRNHETKLADAELRIQRLVDEQSLQIAIAVERLIDLQGSLATLREALPKNRNRLIDAALVDTDARLQRVIDGLRWELDSGIADPIFAAQLSKSAPHPFVAAAGLVLATFLGTEAAEDIDASDARAAAGEVWELALVAVDELVEIADLVIAAGVDPSTQPTEAASSSADGSGTPLENAMADLQEKVNSLDDAKSSLPAESDRSRAHEIQGMLRDVETVFDEAWQNGIPPDTTAVARLRGALSGFASATDGDLTTHRAQDLDAAVLRVTRLMQQAGSR